jgi:hypothetical protein
MDFVAGRGKIFTQKNSKLVPYPSTPSTSWIPYKTFPRGELAYRTTVDAAHILESLFQNHASFASLPEQTRVRWEAEFDALLRLHRLIMGRLPKDKTF